MMETPRTPMDNLMNILSSLSAGHEKALKQGIYNAVAIFLLGIVSLAGYGLFLVLTPFLKPLIWALLCGSVLFPFKYYLTNMSQQWFTTAEASNHPLFFSVAAIPLNAFDQLSDTIGSFSQTYLKYILSAGLAMAGTLMAYNYTPPLLCWLCWKTFEICHTILSFFISACNIYSISLVLLGYVSLLYLCWKPEHKYKFRFCSYGIWFMISLYLSNALGTYPLLIFSVFQILYLVGFIYEVILALDRHESEERRTSLMSIVKSTFLDSEDSGTASMGMPTLVEDESSSLENESIDAKGSEITRIQAFAPKPFLKVTGRSMSVNAGLGKNLQDHPARRVRSAGNMSGRITVSDRYFLSKLRSELRMTLDIEDRDVDSDKYMYGTMYACLGMILWKNKWIVVLLIIPIGYYYLKKLYCYFGIKDIITQQCSKITNFVNTWCQDRHQALVPVNVRGLYKVSIIVDKKIAQILKSSVDAVVTIAVILALLIFVICTSIFITIQIYSEGMHLIQITGDILNSTLMNHPDIDWVPEQWEDSVNSVLDNAYMYGRGAISDGIHKLVKDLEPNKAEHVEKKFLELWDRLYQAWMMSTNDEDMIGPTVNAHVAYSAWESIKDGFGKTPLHLFNMTSIQNFAKENIGILMSVLDSIWSIVKGNMSVVVSIVTELLYIVLISGSAVLNFALSMVVFFTALFYLLSSSVKAYKPIEVVSLFSPIGCHSHDEKGFAIALQESVIGVFTATFKLASFFGMWTWLMHNLFQVRIVYVPSVLATLLGAVPFLDAYFACIPATIELWFTQGAFVAIIFFLVHFIACNVVVTEFYKEIKGGGHPYLTGLSIAGGVFCLGIEGAIFGPLLLCCIMVAINLSRRYLQSPSEEAINSIKSQIDRLESK
ncbi:transmembrane protein 245 isoform X1 [Trichogramma pretiosum]|uniref:transmembrane protein 245 isoform X1 n=1 Tax=Trichogramma pretiosum TaxID=7493 RepID=UPI0006C9BB42|nr:transmembrane protein 245 isoform X1 [Trichogramma pretiosum]